MARVAYQMALTSARIRAAIVEVSEFPQLSQKYQVRAVPTTIIDEQAMFVGAAPVKAVVELVLKAAEGTLLMEPKAGGEATPTTTAERGRERTTPGGLILP